MPGMPQQPGPVNAQAIQQAQAGGVAHRAGSRFEVWGLGFRVLIFAFGVWGLGFGVEGLGCGFWG